MFDPQTTINCRGKLLELDTPKIMGILNVTPDSFYDGGKYSDLDKLMDQVYKMVQQGADIIDIGAASSRPGADLIRYEKEWERLGKPLTEIRAAFPEVIISLDTYNAKTAEKGLELGVDIINDISAGSIDPGIIDLISGFQVPYVLMHMQGEPSSMQDKPDYEDAVLEVLDFFIDKTEKLRRKGIFDIILDPGFGFGKSNRHNFEILRKLHVFRILDLPILAGISRKSMICKTLGVNPDDALNGTTALNMIALEEGAGILRVHDVKEARETIKLWEALNQSE